MQSLPRRHQIRVTNLYLIVLCIPSIIVILHYGNFDFYVSLSYDSCTNFHLCSSCLEKSGKHNHSMNEESMSSSTSELSSTSETYEVESWAGQDLTFTEVSHILKAVGHAITCQCVIKGPSCTLGQNLLCHLEV